MISAIGRVIRRSRSAGTGRFDPGRVGNARAAHRATAENLLALLETVIGAVHGAGWALQAEWPLFGLSERPLMRRDEQRRGNHNRWERRSAHEEFLSALQTKPASDCSAPGWADWHAPGGWEAKGRRPSRDTCRGITPPPRRAAYHPTTGRRRARAC